MGPGGRMSAVQLDADGGQRWSGGHDRGRQHRCCARTQQRGRRLCRDVAGRLAARGVPDAAIARRESQPVRVRAAAPAVAQVAISILFGALFTAAGWRFFGMTRGLVLAQDWMVYHEASSAVLAGDLALLSDGVRFTEALALRFQDVLSGGLMLRPWVYPPPFLLLILPLGILGPMASLRCFPLGPASRACCSRSKPGPASREQRAVLIVSTAASPAAMFTLLAGQNAFFTAALLVGGLAMLGRTPAMAGALLGLLVFKPQLAVLVPVALLARRPPARADCRWLLGRHAEPC